MSIRDSIALVVSALLISAVLLLVGCGVGDQSQEVLPGVNPDPAMGPGVYAVPPEPDLVTPESAVASYLDWVTLAFRLANSDLSTPTMTPFEDVRVDSYIELNRQENRAIDQTITVFEIEEVLTQEPTATVSAYEEWRYRYFTLDTLVWIGEEEEVSFDAIYTVILQPDGRWLVDSVEATELTEVP